jgi:hypothetical protein
VEVPAGVEDILVEHQVKMCIIRVEEEVDLSTVGRIRLKKKYIKLMAMVTYYLKHAYDCFIRYKTRGAAERFISDKTRLQVL